jgi:hypothetical protein
MKISILFLIAFSIFFATSVESKEAPSRFEVGVGIGQLTAPNATFGTKSHGHKQSSTALGIGFRMRFSDHWLLTTNMLRAGDYRFQEPGPACPGDDPEPCPVISGRVLNGEVENLSFGIAYELARIDTLSITIGMNRLRSKASIQEHGESRHQGNEWILSSRYHLKNRVFVGGEVTRSEIESGKHDRYRQTYAGLNAGFGF